MAPPAKRRKTEPKVEEINFDLSARQEFLTGFHKRKLQRAKHAQEAAEKKAREEKIAERKRIREERKADLERHVKELDALMRPAEAEAEAETDEAGEGEAKNGVIEEWEGLEDHEPPPIDHEAEYIDEDKYTTVTVESVDPSRDGLAKLGQDSDRDTDEGDVKKEAEPKKSNVKVSKVKTVADKQRSLQKKLNKRKRKNFRYESKIERKVSRTKERLKNSKQARARKAD